MSKPTIKEYQELVAAVLSDDVYMAEHGVNFVGENKLDIEATVNNNLRDLGINGTVMTPDLTFQGLDSEGYVSYTINTLTIQLSEFTTINRARQNPCTAQEAASRAIAVLIQNFGHGLTPKTIKTIERNGFLVVNAILTTNLTVSSPQPLEDVIGEEIP